MAPAWTERAEPSIKHPSTWCPGSWILNPPCSASSWRFHCRTMVRISWSCHYDIIASVFRKLSCKVVSDKTAGISPSLQNNSRSCLGNCLITNACVWGRIWLSLVFTVSSDEQKFLNFMESDKSIFLYLELFCIFRSPSIPWDYEEFSYFYFLKS